MTAVTGTAGPDPPRQPQPSTPTRVGSGSARAGPESNGGPPPSEASGPGPEADPGAELGAELGADLGTVHATADIDEASAVLSRSYTELTMQLPSPTRPFGMRFQQVELPGAHLALLDLTTTRLRTAPYPVYTACFPVRGRVRAGAGGGPGGGELATIAGARGVAVGPASGELSVDYLGDDCRVLTVTVARDTLERELEVMLGRSPGGPVRFDFSFDVARCPSLGRSLAFVRRELTDPVGPLGTGVGLRQMSRLLTTGLLLCLHHDWSDELCRPAGVEGPTAIRRAVAAIEAEPMAFGTVTDIAREANLSVRALEAGFRRHVGEPPMAHLRRTRLARAHAELVAAEPGSTTATAVAQRWGFVHYGRFTAEYRRRFGCSPRDTLRRGPGRTGGW